MTDRVNVAQYPLLRAAILIESGDEVAAETAANAMVDYAEFYTRAVIVGRNNS